MEQKLVLIVDDEQDLREVIEMSLQLEGYRTLSAEGGHKALELFEQYKIDAVVTDIRMPAGDGISLLKILTLHHPQTPVYIITGYSDYPTSELLNLGAKGVLCKPFELDELHGKLQESLRTS